MGKIRLQKCIQIEKENIEIYDYIFKNCKEETLIIYSSDTEIFLEQNIQKILDRVYILLEEKKIEYSLGNISLVIIVRDGISDRLKMNLENDKLYLKKYVIDNIKITEENLENELKKRIPCMFYLENQSTNSDKHDLNNFLKCLESNNLVYEILKKYKLEKLQEMTVKDIIKEVASYEDKKN